MFIILLYAGTEVRRRIPVYDVVVKEERIEWKDEKGGGSLQGLEIDFIILEKIIYDALVVEEELTKLTDDIIAMDIKHMLKDMPEKLKDEMEELKTLLAQTQGILDVLLDI